MKTKNRDIEILKKARAIIQSVNLQLDELYIKHLKAVGRKKAA